MPFTFAHPAVVLPLIRQKKIRLSATGLIIGSIIPDFEAFIRLNTTKIYGHSWLGIFWFDLPLAFVVAYIYHYAVREALIYNLPTFLNKRFQRFYNVNWHKLVVENWKVILLSLLIGIISHLLLDDLTHLNTLPDNEIIASTQHRQYLSAFLQTFTSIACLVYIVLYMFRIKPGIQGNNYHLKWIYWLVTFGLTLVTYHIITLDMYMSTENEKRYNIYIASFLLVLTFVSLYYKLILLQGSKSNSD